ncbi:MAG: hypothetical protein IPP42_01940 [Saprospiraceae bacterium]|nr:hypothetical protein [Saprospiraceae bacterium]
MTKAQDPTSTYMIKSWVEQYADTLYTWVYYKTRNKELSEDLVQDTFWQLYNCTLHLKF